jgi:hypothetical protein
MGTETAAETASHDLVRWRREQLLRSGFPRPLAARLAEDPRYDLHEVTELAARGCPPDLAMRILAPLADVEAPAA